MRTIAVAPFVVSDREVVSAFMERLAVKLAREVEESLLQSRTRALITECAFPCEGADVTLMVGYEASQRTGFGPGQALETEERSAQTLWSDEAKGVQVVVVARLLRNDGAVIDQRVYVGTRHDAVSGRQYTRPVAELARGALDDAIRQLLDDLLLARK